jgi:hypothetical protein
VRVRAILRELRQPLQSLGIQADLSRATSSLFAEEHKAVHVALTPSTTLSVTSNAMCLSPEDVVPAADVGQRAATHRKGRVIVQSIACSYYCSTLTESRTHRPDRHRTRLEAIGDSKHDSYHVISCSASHGSDPCRITNSRSAAQQCPSDPSIDAQHSKRP